MAFNSTIIRPLGFSLLVFMFPLGGYAADSRSPLTGDPVETLPRMHAPKAQQPQVRIEAGTPNRAVEIMLAQPVTPNHFAIEGVKSLPFESVAEHFSRLAGKQVTVADLINASNAVTTLYQDHGYVLSFCIIPAQDFAQGQVRVVVVEGHVDKVTLTGNAGAAERKIRAISARMLQDKPLKRATFERTINLLIQLPGVKVAATVPPPQTVGGATELQLNVDRKPVTIGTSISLNQPGVRGIIALTTNSLTPLAEQMSLSVLAPRGRDKEEYYSASYAQPVGSYGMQMRLDASRYRGHPQNVALHTQSLARLVANDRLGATLSYPFLLGNTRNLTGSLSAYAANNADTFENINTAAKVTSNSNLRVMRGDLSYTEAAPRTMRNLSVGLAKGFNALGANRDVLASQTLGQTGLGNFDLNFSKLLVQASQSNDWPHHLGTAVALAGQYSRSTLASSEQILFGGTRFGLGYPVGEIAGDSGWGASFEINRSVATDIPYLKQMRHYLLYDTAHVSLNQAALQHKQIASVAAGMRFTDSQYYNLDLSVAKPVGQAPIESASRNPRLNASFSYQFN